MSYQINVLPSATLFNSEENETVLQAALRQGINLPHSCQSGVCGSCRARLISGQIEQGIYDDYVLDNEEKQSGMILLCCSHARSNLQIDMPTYSGVKALPIRTLPARVVHIDRRGDVAILTVNVPKAPPFKFYAGQYMDILLPDGATRSYSIANAPEQHDAQLEFHIRYHENGLFSPQLFDERLTVGSMMRLRGPLGSFILNEESNKPLILMATGTGLAPIKSILLHLKHIRSSQAIHIYHGGRKKLDLYDEAALAVIINNMTNVRYTPVLSQADATWTGARGHIQQQVIDDYPNLEKHEVYACGSVAMINDARHLFIHKAALPESAFFSDAFTVHV